MTTNNALIYKSHPVSSGGPKNEINFKFEKRPFDLDSVNLQDNELLTENLYLSLDPFMLALMNPGQGVAGISPYALNQPLFSHGVAKVLQSKNSSFQTGDIVFGILDLSEYTVVKATAASFFRVIKNKHDLPLSYYTGVLGLAGMTAYSGFNEYCKVKKGDTMFISGASGAVGQLVGQLAKLEGLYVVGCAGTDEKVQYMLNTLKFDGAFNYKKEKVLEALPKYCAKGIDVFFDNVGGEILDAVFLNMNKNGRIVACGMISDKVGAKQHGLMNMFHIIPKGVCIFGLIVTDFWAKYQPEMDEKLEQLLKDKKIVYQEDVCDLEKAGEALQGLFEGKNFGKALVRIHGSK